MFFSLFMSASVVFSLLFYFKKQTVTKKMLIVLPVRADEDKAYDI